MSIVGTYDTTNHQANILLLLPQAVAYEWILRYLDNLNDMIRDGNGYGHSDPITLDELLSTAESHLDGGWGDYIIRGGTFEGYPLDMTFWDKYEILFEKEIPYKDRTSFLSCSC